MKQGCTLKLAAASFQREDRRQWVRRAIRPGEPPGSVTAAEAASLAAANLFRLIGKGFGFAPPAHARLPDRPSLWALLSLGQPRSCRTAPG